MRELLSIFINPIKIITSQESIFRALRELYKPLIQKAMLYAFYKYSVTDPGKVEKKFIIIEEYKQPEVRYDDGVTDQAPIILKRELTK